MFFFSFKYYIRADLKIINNLIVLSVIFRIKKIGHIYSVPSDCEAIAHLRFRHLGQFFMAPDDCNDAPISKVLQLIRSVELIKQ
jgi:hypothetical protein